MEHCTECERAIPTTHYHYEEFDDVLASDPVKVYASKPHPRPSVDAWEELMDSARRRTKVEKPLPDVSEVVVHESQYHEMWHRLDDGDFICDACGAVSGDFDLFEEVGIENECHVPEPVVEAEPVDTAETVSVKATASKEVMDLYKKMLDDITKAEHKRMRAYKMPEWPSTVTWSPRRYTIDETVEKTLEEKSHKTYAELAKEFKAASEKPENQKKWYSEVHNEMQRRERRR